MNFSHSYTTKLTKIINVTQVESATNNAQTKQL